MSLFFLYKVIISCATINAEKTDPKDNTGIELNKNFTHELFEGDMIFPKSGLPLFRYLPQGF
jgi:hypothetical protein